MPLPEPPKAKEYTDADRPESEVIVRTPEMFRRDPTQGKGDRDRSNRSRYAKGWEGIDWGKGR